MRKVYLSFLGAGKYEPAIYHINGVRAGENIYVQCAELEIMGKGYFDVCYFVITPTSKEKHFNSLKGRLEQMGVTNIVPIEITEELEAEHQWEWSEEILTKVDPHDHLTIDMTHGFRIIPIIFSAAINFLQKAKGITLNAVYYGAYESDKNLSPIIDMKDFYMINEWADSVSRLVEDADARKMALVAGQTSGPQIGELNDEKVIKAFDDLTNSIRNVDVNNVAIKANAALNLIKEKEKTSSITGKILLNLVIDKFTSLTTAEPISGNYDKAYFSMQLEIIRLLLEHKLFMQAYTVMREFIGSIGLIEVKKANMRNSAGRKQRNKAEVFINMLTIKEKNWNFDGKEPLFSRVELLYKKLKKHQIEPILRDFCRELTNYRNGFDHAWTSKPGASPDIEEKGILFFEKLINVIFLLENKGIL